MPSPPPPPHLTPHRSVGNWPPRPPSSTLDAHWPPLEAQHLDCIRIASAVGEISVDPREIGGQGAFHALVLPLVECAPPCGCCRVHRRPLPRPLSTPTNSHNRSSIRRPKNAISPPPLLTPAHALHELSTRPTPPPPGPPPGRGGVGGGRGGGWGPFPRGGGGGRGGGGRGHGR
jgi:hypothetical protein